MPLQANAYSIHGNVRAYAAYGGDSTNRSTNGGAATYLSDSASSLGDSGTSAASAYFADLSTGLLGTYIAGANPMLMYMEAERLQLKVRSASMTP